MIGGEYETYDWDRSIDHPAKPIPDPKADTSKSDDLVCGFCVIFILAMAAIAVFLEFKEVMLSR